MTGMTTAGLSTNRCIGERQFREALARFPTGVAVLTAATLDNRKVGLTVSSFNSVSLRPPLVLWSISRATPSFPAFQSVSYFCVNVLCKEQVELARHFARASPDKFATVPHFIDVTGVPVLYECAMYLICRTWGQYDGGDHLIIVGQVTDLATTDRQPLVFGLGRFCRLLSDLSDRP